MMAAPAFPRGLVWLASYPKSGNTWLRILLANLSAVLEGARAGQDINALTLPMEVSNHRDLFLDDTLLDPTLLTAAEINGLRPDLYAYWAAQAPGPLFVKSHDPYLHTARGGPVVGSAGRAAVYVVRDPRDVVISYAHHSNSTADAMITVLTDPAAAPPGPEAPFGRLPQRLGCWADHVTGWLDQRDLPVHLVRYEDLLADTPAEFTRLLAFLGINAPAAAVRQAVEFSAFRRLQQQEQAGDFIERHGDSPFFRQGKAGGWRGMLTPAQIITIETATAPVMDRLGYTREYRA